MDEAANFLPRLFGMHAHQVSLPAPIQLRKRRVDSLNNVDSMPTTWDRNLHKEVADYLPFDELAKKPTRSSIANFAWFKLGRIQCGAIMNNMPANERVSQIRSALVR